MALEITDGNIAETLGSNKITLIDFWAAWCGPCRMLGPIIDNLAKENPDVAIGKVDVDAYPELALKYSIRSLPTILIFKDGEVVEKVIGCLIQVFIDMKKKLKITESQLLRLKLNLSENNAHSNIVKQMKEELDKNYQPIDKFVREGGEYSEKPMIQIKADEEVITPKSLYEYLKMKYKMGREFTEQVIKDWMYGKITDDFRLSKNVALTDKTE
jgi:thioredoxin 1